MSHAARLMNKKVAVILVIALVLSALVGPFGLGVASASEDQVSRVEGKNRYETAANIAKAAYPDGNDTVIVARGENVIADALAASVLAGAKNAPILLTKEKSLPPETRQAIEDLGAEQVYILGNEYAISKAVEDALKELVGESNVKRVAGNDRYETAVAVAKEAVSSAEKAYLANGEKTVDALVAGPAAFVNQVPVLLVKQDSIPDVVWEALNDLGVEEVVLVGSEEVISKAVADALEAEGYDVRRVDGKDRFETSVEFAKSEFPEAASYGIVKGEHHDKDKDAESGVDAVAAVVLGQPLLYATKNGVLNDTVQNFIAERAAANPAVTFTIFGDENAVVADVDKDVQKIIEENAEVKVVSVSAISQTIKAGEEQALKFMVNGKEELTAAEFKEKYGVAGYTVEFLYNKPGFDKKTGVVKTSNHFKYAVQVTDAEGNVIPEGGVKHTDFVEVKVVKAGEPVEVTALGLEKDGEKWKLDYITKTDENVKIVVTEAIDAFGEKVSNPQEVKIKAIKSSDITVAYYDDVDGIVPRKPGQVTFTVEFENNDLEAVVFPLEIREGQKADSIAIEQPVKVKADAEATVEFDVLDQYGEKLRTNENVTVTIDGEDVQEGNKQFKEGKVSITITLKEGTHKAVVKAGNKQIGTFTIEAVNVENVPIEEYTFKLVAEEAELDIYPEAEKLETDIQVKAYIYGVEVDVPDVAFIAKSSNEEVVKVEEDENDDNKFKVTAVGVGSATITLYIQEHDLVTPVARLDVTVKNTTPQINDLQLKEGVEKLSVTQDEKGEWQLDDATQLVSKDAEFSENMVEKIIYSKNDGKAVVKLKPEYGGKEFVFPAEFINTEDDNTGGDDGGGDKETEGE